MSRSGIAVFDALVSCKLMGRKPLYKHGQGGHGPPDRAGFSVTVDPKLYRHPYSTAAAATEYPECVAIPANPYSVLLYINASSHQIRIDWLQNNLICSEALIIFDIHEYTAILVKFEYFMVISLVSSNF
jgi:hypothetical protein